MPKNSRGRCGVAVPVLFLACQAGGVGETASQQAMTASEPRPTVQGANVPTTPPANDVVAPPAQVPRLTVIGRTVPLDPSDPIKQQVGRGGVAFGARFSGKSLSITLQNLSTNLTFYFGVKIDGQAQAPLVVAGGPPASFTLADDLPEGEHEVWWTSRSESTFNGSVQLLAVDVDPTGSWLSPPTAPSRGIEIIGASADNGFAVDAPSGPGCNGFSGMDPDLAWPKLTGDAVGARTINSALSQQGMLAVNHYVAGTVWPRADPLVANPTGNMSQGIGAVFIDLTENDYNTLGGAGLADPSNQQLWQAAAHRLVAAVLAVHPGAWTYFIVNSSQPANHRPVLRQMLTQVVADLQAAGNPSVAFAEFPFDPNSQVQCYMHPDRGAHQAMAQQATALLRRDLGW